MIDITKYLNSVPFSDIEAVFFWAYWKPNKGFFFQASIPNSSPNPKTTPSAEEILDTDSIIGSFNENQSGVEKKAGFTVAFKDGRTLIMSFSQLADFFNDNKETLSENIKKAFLYHLRETDDGTYILVYFPEHIEGNQFQSYRAKKPTSLSTKELIIHSVDYSDWGDRETPFLTKSIKKLESILQKGINSSQNACVYFSIPLSKEALYKERLPQQFLIVAVDPRTLVFDSNDKSHWALKSPNYRKPLLRKGMSIAQFLKERKQGKKLFLGEEVLMSGTTPLNAIIGYTKNMLVFEENTILTEIEKTKIADFINHILSDYTFSEKHQNVALFYDDEGKRRYPKGYYLRVVFDREKSEGKQEEIEQLLAPFTTLKELLTSANTFSKIRDLVDDKILSLEQALKLSPLQQKILKSRGIRQLITHDIITLNQALNLNPRQCSTLRSKIIRDLLIKGNITLEKALGLSNVQRKNLESTIEAFTTTGLVEISDFVVSNALNDTPIPTTPTPQSSLSFFAAHNRGISLSPSSYTPSISSASDAIEAPQQASPASEVSAGVLIATGALIATGVLIAAGAKRVPALYSAIKNKLRR